MIGKTLGHQEMMSPLGRAGIGKVFQADNLSRGLGDMMRCSF